MICIAKPPKPDNDCCQSATCTVCEVSQPDSIEITIAGKKLVGVKNLVIDFGILPGVPFKYLAAPVSIKITAVPKGPPPDTTGWLEF